MSHEEFECLNCLLVTSRFKKCANLVAFRYFNKQCPNYLNEVFDAATESTFLVPCTQLRSNISTISPDLRLKILLFMLQTYVMQSLDDSLARPTFH